MTEATPPRLARDVFVALAALCWSDGELHPDEAEAIARTAHEEGYDAATVDEIRSTMLHPVDLGTIDLTALTKEDRLFVYAVASWLVRIDGKQTPEELATLTKVGDVLKVPARPREHADAIAVEIAALPEGDRPARFDLKRLRATIGERLREAQRLRAEANAPTT